jgi:hypothetical protein
MTTAPRLVAARSDKAALPVPAGGFDPDLYHAMDERDGQLVRDEVLHGRRSKAFVYQFRIQGTEVSGVSVVGARHLAHFYKGLKHRIVASAEKRGSLFKFVSYPAEGTPMSVSCASVPELSDEPDHITVVVEVTDLKTGNTVQAERTENRWETRSKDGSQYERPNYATIAQSKAYRNAVLALLPQDVIEEFEQLCIRQGRAQDITEDTLEGKRRRCLQFATRNGLRVDRRALQQLGWEQLAGLSDAVKDGKAAFSRSLEALGLMEGAQPAEDGDDDGNGNGNDKPNGKSRRREGGDAQPQDEQEAVEHQPEQALNTVPEDRQAESQPAGDEQGEATPGQKKRADLFRKA